MQDEIEHSVRNCEQRERERESSGMSQSRARESGWGNGGFEGKHHALSMGCRLRLEDSGVSSLTGPLSSNEKWWIGHKVELSLKKNGQNFESRCPPKNIETRQAKWRARGDWKLIPNYASPIPTYAARSDHFIIRWKRHKKKFLNASHQRATALPILACDTPAPTFTTLNSNCSQPIEISIHRDHF